MIDYLCVENEDDGCEGQDLAADSLMWICKRYGAFLCEVEDYGDPQDMQPVRCSECLMNQTLK